MDTNVMHHRQEKHSRRVGDVGEPPSEKEISPNEVFDNSLSYKNLRIEEDWYLKTPTLFDLRADGEAVTEELNKGVSLYCTC